MEANTEHCLPSKGSSRPLSVFQPCVPPHSLPVINYNRESSYAKEEIYCMNIFLHWNHIKRNNYFLLFDASFLQAEKLSNLLCPPWTTMQAPVRPFPFLSPWSKMARVKEILDLLYFHITKHNWGHKDLSSGLHPKTWNSQSMWKWEESHGWVLWIKKHHLLKEHLQRGPS